MTPLTDLLLAIGISAIAVFFASFIIWGVLPIHKPDMRRLPDEDAFAQAIAPLNLEPGNYIFPQPADPADYKTEAFQAKYNAGPWGLLRLNKARPNFSRNLLLTFLVYLGVIFLSAYLTSRGVAPGSAFIDVFQIAFTACALGFVFGGLPGDIFFAKPRRFMLTQFIDAIIFAAVGSAVLSFMWP